MCFVYLLDEAGERLVLRGATAAQQLAEAALDETRLAIAGLHPPVLDDLGLAASLESLARSIPQLEVHADASPASCPRTWPPPSTASPRRRCRTSPSTPRPAPRDDLVVILAGYRDRMDSFFASNPGMASRVAHHIDFPDFTVDELVRIAELMAARESHRFAPEARQALREYLERRMAQPRFANARSVRNALDRMRLRQANRLVAAGELVGKDDLVRLEARRHPPQPRLRLRRKAARLPALPEPAVTNPAAARPWP